MPPPRPGTKVFSLAATTAMLRLFYNNLFTEEASVTVLCWEIQGGQYNCSAASSSSHNTSCFHPRTWFYIGLWLREPLSGVATQTPAPATGRIVLGPLLSVAILTGRWWKKCILYPEISSSLLLSWFNLLHARKIHFDIWFNQRGFLPSLVEIDWYW